MLTYLLPDSIRNISYYANVNTQVITNLPWLAPNFNNFFRQGGDVRTFLVTLGFLNYNTFNFMTTKQTNFEQTGIFLLSNIYILAKSITFAKIIAASSQREIIRSLINLAEGTMLRKIPTRSESLFYKERCQTLIMFPCLATPVLYLKYFFNL